MDRKHAKGVFAEQLMAQKYRLERYTEDELIKLYTALNLVRDKIVRGWGKTIKTEYSQTQALAMLEEARKIMADIKPKIEGSIAGTIGKVSEESASVYSDMITFGGAARAAEAALLSAQQMESFWRHTPVGGQLLNEWVTKTFDGPTVDRIQREVFAGMFQGEGYGEMVKRLQEGFVISKREADTLVRTYVHTANVHAMEEVYKKNRDVIAGVSWLTAFDKRTCMRCAALSGKLFPLDDHPPCPLHPRCRCVLVPETDIRKLKVKPKVADDWAKGLRDKRPPGLDTVLTPDGIPKTDFRRWILAQPEKDQLAFFGPTRYGLLKDGKIGWDDLFEETRFGGKENVRLRKLTELLGDRVAAHRAGKGYNVAVEQLALARAEREALDLARHEVMAAGLDKEAVRKIMYPRTLVGVERGKKMSYNEMYKRGDINPGYKEDLPGRRSNCQTCVVAAEARAKGYRNIEALANLGNDEIEKLMNDWTLAWIDPLTGKAPVVPRSGCKSKVELIKYVNDLVRKGERYLFRYDWLNDNVKDGKPRGHIVHIFRDTDGVVKLYDPQSNRFCPFEDYYAFYCMLFEHNGYDWSPQLFRVDNIGFNLRTVRKILTKKARRK